MKTIKKATKKTTFEKNILNWLKDLQKLIETTKEYADGLYDRQEKVERKLDRRDTRIKELKGFLAQERDQRKCLEGYVERVTEMEQPEERRRMARRRNEEPRHHHDFYDHLDRKRDSEPRPWYE